MKQNKAPRKEMMISACTDLVGDHGAHRRDKQQSYRLKKDK